MATVTIADLAALAENLTTATADAKDTAKHLKQRIEAEGLKIGAQISKNHALAAKEQIAKVTEEAKSEIQRQADLIAEFRRQREPLERAADKANLIATAVRRAHYAGEDCISVKALLDIINAPTSPDADQASARRTTNERQDR
jgi:phage shock protein A